MRILVHGHIGMGNLGDELMLAPILSALGQRHPDAQLVVAGGKLVPQALLEQKSIEFVPRSALRLCWEILRCRIFVVSGGTHLTSFCGSSRYLRGIIRQLLLVLWARLTFSRVLMLSVGFGPFEEPVGRRLAKLVVRLAHYVTARDAQSYQWLSKLKLPEASYGRCHDAAMFTKRMTKSRPEPYLGISLMPYFANYSDNSEKDEAIVEQFVTIIERWQSIFPQAKVCLFSFLKQDSIYTDSRVLGSIKRRFLKDENVLLVDIVPDIQLASEHFSEFTHFISMRYHSQVMAWLNEVPQLCITYHRKNRFFAAEYGIGKHACFDVQEVLAGNLEQKVEDFFRNTEKYTATVLPSDIGFDKDTSQPIQLTTSW